VSGSAWASVGDPANGSTAFTGVYGLAFDSSGNLYAVGDFDDIAGTANAEFVAKWDGASWTALGDPLTGAAAITEVLAIAIDSSDQIYVGGDFTTFANLSGDGVAHYVCRWNGTAWEIVTTLAYQGNGTYMSTVVRALYYDPVRDIIYYGGDFTNRYDANGDYVTSGVGAHISLGTGMNGIVHGITGDGQGNIIAVGEFTTAGGVSCDRIAKWNGSVWSSVDLLPGATVQCVEIGAVNPIDSTAYDWYIGLLDTVTLSDATAGSTAITNNGNQASYPRFVFKRAGGTSATLKSITNQTTGDELAFDYNLQDGETLTIDLAPAEKSITSNTNGSQYGAVSAGSDFGTFSLLPGSNTITCFITEAGAPTITAFVIWRDAYWSVS